MISVIVPAHDEADVIGRCLGALVGDAEPGELEVIVVCNACSDATAERARQFGSAVRVIETEVASKCDALNVGDVSASGYPRFYVDADVVLPLKSLRCIARLLREGGALVASPALRVELAGCGVAVRAYYAAWTRLPYVRSGPIGSGVYALSEEGRARFGRFPELLTDDGYVRFHFEPEERRCVEAAEFWIHPPRSLLQLVRVLARRRGGVDQMQLLFPTRVRAERRKQRAGLLRLALRPLLWPALGVYVGVRAAVGALYHWRRRRGRARDWTRDDTSRTPAPPGARPGS